MADIDCTLPENMEMDECMDMHDDDHDMDHEDGGMMTQAKWLMGSMMNAVMYSLMVGRYRYDAMDFYTAGDQYLGTDSMNWWKIANSVRLYPAAAIWSVLTITQLLSMVGVAPEINLMAWRFGVMAWMLTSMIAHALNFYGYESAYSWYAEDTTNNTLGGSMMQVIGTEEMQMVAKETSIAMGLTFMMEKWLMGQVMMLPEEAQEKYMDKKGGKKHDDHDDEDDMEFSLRAFYGF